MCIRDRDILDTLQRCELITEKKAGARWYVRLGRALLRIFAPLM